jgi:hypothetical protein
MSLESAWKVLVVFLIPFGGGIPGGVLLAKNYQIAWPYMMLLYFISDLILACVFEPVLRLCILFGKDKRFFTRLSEAFKLMVKKTISHYGDHTGPLALILIAFGVDPMTGRAAAIATGHGFVVGWMIAIAGDMIYFTLLMVSTLWLNGIIGDGNTTMLVILGLMIALPVIIRRVREKFRSLRQRK